ncbi:hypothetical protein [Bacillus wiedmannii]|uniref:Uncharacterized protein n=1 Tax=Bacillus wiedmannii TaxID=1890302 RepID=A0A2B5XSZ8_9BACI|nr:hypothetical protein [Bacillus wiedmannii]PEM55374.1 hypothetical protein CN611_14810 [Bacillus wiedmannii]PGA99475.1 hypothetical protein COL92_06700 [Bacillus wiedmannii]
MNEQNGKLSDIEFEMILDDFKNQLPLQIKYHGELAKLYKARFDALIKEGFTQDQALDIVAARGIS